jgi:hypothetical protein
LHASGQGFDPYEGSGEAGEHGVEIYRCDPHLLVGFVSRINRDFDIL